MKMDKVAGSGNDEFYTPKYAVEPILKYVDRTKTIWCPFDTEQSNFVIMLRNSGCNVVVSHKETGGDFFLSEPEHYDMIISNPPYSIKGEVF